MDANNIGFLLAKQSKKFSQVLEDQIVHFARAIRRSPVYASASQLLRQKVTTWCPARSSI